MSVLKARVGGVWQVIPSVAAISPTSDQSFQRLRLTANDEATLVSTFHALQIGPDASANLRFDANEVQAVSNGVAAQLTLNEHGGNVRIGGADAGQFPGSLQLAESTHATSRRAYMKIGTGWEIGQDTAANGTRDLFIWAALAGRVGMQISADALSLIIQQNIWFGGGVSGTTNPRIASDGTYLNFQSRGHLYNDIAGPSNYNYWRRATDFASLMSLDGTGNLVVNTNITSSVGSMYLSGGKWFRATPDATGEGGLYFEVVGGKGGGGFHMIDTTWVRVYNGKWLHCGGYIQTGSGFRSEANAMLTHATDTSTGLWYRGQYSVGLAVFGSDRLLITGNNTWAKAEGFTEPSNKSWAFACLVAQNPSAAANVTIAGFSANPANGGVAPMWFCNPRAGEEWAATNNPNSAWCAIVASAFKVGSTERIKTDIQPMAHADVLTRIRSVQAIRYRDRIRPQNIDQLPDGTWSLTGHHDHDCTIDPCDGTADDPCCIALNDRERVGLSAERLFEVFPEAVSLGPDKLPETVNIAAVAALALAGVGALLNRIEQLERNTA